MHSVGTIQRVTHVFPDVAAAVLSTIRCFRFDIHEEPFPDSIVKLWSLRMVSGVRDPVLALHSVLLDPDLR